MLEVNSNVSKNGVATITLNRPKALNSININMVRIIHSLLKEWENNNEVKLIVMEGEGERAFCAGGDIKSLYDAQNNEEVKMGAINFFEEEYKLDAYIDEYSKPIIVDLSGIVMGGGVGLSYGADFRIVSEKTMWAMPEMNLGFFPDVGAGYFLNKAKNNYGRYLALTGKTINGADAKLVNAADYIIPSNKINEILDLIKIKNWLDVDVNKELKILLDNNEDESIIKSELLMNEKSILSHFKYDTVEKIIESLESDPSEFANQTKKEMLGMSPVSLKVALKQLIVCENKSLVDCLAIDNILAKNFMNHADFYEGIRSVLIDKDRMPNYKYKVLSDVSEELVDSFFTK